MKLTRDQVRRLLPGQTLVAECSDTAELLSAYETAKSTRRELGRDRRLMPISCSYKTMAVAVCYREDAPSQ